MTPPKHRGIPGRYMAKSRARAIHAFHRAAIVLAATTPFFTGPLGWIVSGDPAIGLAAASAGLMGGALVACTVVDCISMRIPNALSVMPLLAALLWWAALAMGAPLEEGAGYARNIYAPLFPDAGTGSLLPAWDLPLGGTILASLGVMVIVALPLFLSFVFGMMGGGDVKFIPPFALYLGWSLGFDLLFLTFLFGGVAGVAMLAARAVARVMAARATPHAAGWARVARMPALAYAPGFAAAGVVCLAAKWEGLLV